MTTASSPDRSTWGAAARPRLFFQALFRSDYLVLVLCVLYFGAAIPVTPGLTSADNLGNLLSNLLPLLVVALGQTVVLIGAGIDLSVPSVIALSSITGAVVMNTDTGWLRESAAGVPVALAAMILVGATVGALNGAAVTALRMPPFIVTLTSMMFFSGLTVWLTRSQSIGHLPSGFTSLGANTTIAAAFVLLMALGVHFGLTRSLAGRWLYSVGHNPAAARISGVPVGMVQWMSYVISGVCAAGASILYTARLETGSPVLGQRILLDVIGAAVIGGASLYGGRGKVVWTGCGVLFLTLLDNSLNLLNLSSFAILMAKGTVILLAALLDTTRHRLLARE